MNGQPNVEGDLKLGGGAQFWAYISPQGETSRYITKWKVAISQQDGSWAGVIDSDNPQKTLQTPGLSGIFNVDVWASGPNLPETKLTPLPDSKPDIGCNSNCWGMVGIVAKDGGKAANYWTVWDAICKPPK